MRKPLNFVLFVLLTFVTGLVSAGISLDRAVVRFSLDSPRLQDIKVQNEGVQPLNVKVVPFEVLDPGTKNERKVRIKNPTAAGLLVSPSRFSLSPGKSGRIRMMRLVPKNDENEHIYRVEVHPDAVDVSDSDEEGQGVKFIIAYEALVIIDPNPVRSDLKISMNGGKVLLQNDGNASVLISSGYSCEVLVENNDFSNCSSSPSTRMYPGKGWSFDRKVSSNYVYYRLEQGANRRRVIIDLSSGSAIIKDLTEKENN